MNSLDFAGSLELTPDQSTLDEFLANLARPSQRGTETRVANQAALYCSSTDGTTAAQGGLLGVFTGAAEWTDVQLAELAQQRGMPQALCVAYRRHGQRCLELLRGSFALVVFDPAQRTALAAVDRIGIQGLYFADQRERCVVGSTPQSVAAHPAVGAQIDPQALFNYLHAHVVPAPGSVYSGVRKLLPAQYVVWRNGRSEAGFYWHLEYDSHARRPLAQLEEQFRLLLKDCVSRSTIGSTKIGTFLSGGTDSSTVTGVLADLRSAAVDAYSIGFDAAGFDEMAFARIAARRFKVAHHPYYVTPTDVARAIPLIAGAYSEPFGNASAVPAYYCAKNAADDGVDLMLAGDGGDEIFGGNSRYAKQRVFEAYTLLPPWLRSGLIEPAVLRSRTFGNLPLVRKAASYVRQASIPLPDRLEAYNFLRRSSVSAIFEPAFLAQIDPEQPATLAREVYQRTASTSPIDCMMHLDLKVTLADNDLRKVIRMCEVAGVQVRFPLLVDTMVEFSGHVPAHLKVKGLQLRYFFKHALRDFLPPEILSKEKHGFGLPFGLWMRSDPTLRELAHENLRSFGRRGYVRPCYLAELLEKHRKEDASYYGVMIWVIVMLEEWLARQSSPSPASQ